MYTYMHIMYTCMHMYLTLWYISTVLYMYVSMYSFVAYGITRATHS